MLTEPKVAIVILNWNGFSDTVECLESLKDLNYANYGIVLVDNGSKNNEGTRLKDEFPCIHLIQNSINRGFAGGSNDGIKWALENGYDYIWLLNNDTVIDRNSLKHQISNFSYKNVAAVGSKIKIYDTNRIWSKGIYLVAISFIPPKLKFLSNIDEGREDVIVESAKKIEYISGCSLLIKAKIKNHFFDESFFAYCEDMDICYRIRKEGYALIYEPKSIIYHKMSQSSGGKKLNKLTAYYCFRNKLILLNNLFPKYILFLISPLYLAYLAREIFRIIFFYRDKRVLLKSVFRGVFDGLIYIFNKKATGEETAIC